MGVVIWADVVDPQRYRFICCILYKNGMYERQHNDRARMNSNHRVIIIVCNDKRECDLQHQHNENECPTEHFSQ